MCAVDDVDVCVLDVPVAAALLVLCVFELPVEEDADRGTGPPGPFTA